MAPISSRDALPARYHGPRSAVHDGNQEMTDSSQLIRAVRWLVTALLAIALAYAAFRGYLGAEMLIGFANSLLC
jgi:hypothetical protein